MPGEWCIKQISTKYLPFRLRLRWAWRILRGKVSARDVPLNTKGLEKAASRAAIDEMKGKKVV